MLQHSTPKPHGMKAHRETSGIGSGGFDLVSGASLGVASPPFARWMGYHWQRAGVLPGVPGYVPRIDARLPEVTTIFFNKQGSDQRNLGRVQRMDRCGSRGAASILG